MTDFNPQENRLSAQPSASQPDLARQWPLVPVERYLMADDRHRPAGRGMTFPVYFCFLGQVNLDLWRTSVIAALHRHPILQCRCSRGWQPAWVNSGTPEEVCRTASHHAMRNRSGRIDPASGPPFSWTVHNHPSGCTVLFQFHHAAVDGVGALQFVGDCFHRYHQYTAEIAAPPLSPLNPTLLSNRDHLHEDKPRGTEPPQEQVSLSIPAELKRFFLRRISSLATDLTPDEVGDKTTADPGNAVQADSVVPFVADLFSVEIDAANASRIREAALAAGGTVNDLAMRDLLLTLRDHNERRGKSERWYRLTMPANLRGRADRKLSACNKIGYAFIDRDLKSITDSSDLLAGLIWENNSVRNQRLSGEFLGVLAKIVRVPGLMRLLTSNRLRASSAVFSNIGDPIRRFHWRPPSVDGKIRIGNLQLISMAAAPPIRPGTPASFLLHQLNGCIHLNVLVDRQVIGPAAAKRLLDAWRDRLCSTTDRSGAL
jgi:hypothetical protein